MGIDYNKRPAATPTPAASPGVNLSKISLTKAAPQVNLTKPGESQGVMRVNLNWSAGKSGFFGNKSVDLDLGCLYELADGSKGVIQALGNSFGAQDRPPYIALDGDDRSGAVAGGENMHINLAQPQQFRRILIFAMIYSGAANWAAVDGVVTLYPTSGPPIEVRLDSPVNGAAVCAVAQVYYAEGGLHVQREVKYINGSQSDLDRAYSWGMRWKAGRK
ncbi:TerD family protein [Mycolicibacterium llatzerense]|uniref:TerD family protein n=1 Tax=Mycolicibacterium llatzerense TaxID=280871 RepID=UPI0008DDBB06|nr:Tellurium resistance [Mycolicibacterium llatzerense]